MYVHICTHILTEMYKYTYIHTYVYVSIYLCVCVCVCVYYTYIHITVHIPCKTMYVERLQTAEVRMCVVEPALRVAPCDRCLCTHV
jgi:hypothetical protein